MVSPHSLRECYYCRHKTFASARPIKSRLTAGFEAVWRIPEYIRVMDWIVAQGTSASPTVCLRQACFVEPVNTCLKGIETCVASRETVSVIGQAYRVILGTLANGRGPPWSLPIYSPEVHIAKDLGLDIGIDASRSDAVKVVREMTEGAARMRQF